VTETTPAPVDPIDEIMAGWERHGWRPGVHYVAAFALNRVNVLLRRASAPHLQAHGLTHARHEALARIYFSKHGAMPLGGLSRHLFVRSASITATVDALAGLGYVARMPHPTDRRTTLAQITPAGRAVIESTIDRLAKERCGLSVLRKWQAAELFELLRLPRSAAGDIDTDDPIVTIAANWRAKGWKLDEHLTASLSVYRVETLARESVEVVLRSKQLTRARYQALALLYVHDEGRLALSRMSERLAVHPTNLTATIDALEDNGLLERTAHPSDRRATLARITPRGRRVIEQSNKAGVSIRFGLSALNDSQASALTELLEPIRWAASDMVAPLSARRGGGSPVALLASSSAQRCAVATRPMVTRTIEAVR
jgi:DNA-binding MarR family transcriptional regulator